MILTGKEHSDMIHHSAEDNVHTVFEGIYPLLSVGTDLLDGLLSGAPSRGAPPLGVVVCRVL